MISGREKLKNILIEKYCNHENTSKEQIDFYKQRINLLVSSLLDPTENYFTSRIAPLTFEETLILRTYYGARNSGVIQDSKKVAETLNFSYNTVLHSVKNAHALMDYIICKKDREYEGLTIYDALPDRKKYLDDSIGLATSSVALRSSLGDNGILTIGEMLNYSKRNLVSIIGDANVKKLSETLEAFDIVFIDNLSEDLKRFLFLNSKPNKILNTDISWLSLSSKLETVLRYQGLDVIGRVINLDNKDIQDAISRYGIMDVINTTKADKKNIDLNLFMIENLPISVRTYNSLRRMGISTLAELIKLSEEDLLSKRTLGVTRIQEIKKVLKDLNLSLIQSENAFVRKKGI